MSSSSSAQPSLGLVGLLPINITGGAGDDVLTGGAGINTYSFDLGSGQDIITDFQVSHDVLDLSAYFDGIDGALGSTTQIGNDALINLGDQDSITLSNVAVAELTTDSFSFG